MRVNCFDCKHFYLTHDKNFPRGCRAFAFKSRVLPSLEVYRSSGLKCLHYVKNKRNK